MNTIIGRAEEQGPIQKEWLKTLEEYPELQYAGDLGKTTKTNTIKDLKNAKMCCLGVGGVIAGVCVISDGKVKCLNIDRTNIDFSIAALLVDVYPALGLIDSAGTAKRKFEIHGEEFSRLSQANDGGCTWPEIAKAIKNNPKNFFKESK